MLRNLKGRVCTLREKFPETHNGAILYLFEVKNDTILNVKGKKFRALTNKRALYICYLYRLTLEGQYLQGVQKKRNPTMT